MAFLIWLIIIIAIVWVEAKKQQQKNGTTRPNVPRTPHTRVNGLRTWQNRNQSRANGQQTWQSGSQQLRTNGQQAWQSGNQQSRVNGQQTWQSGNQQARVNGQQTWQNRNQSRANGQRAQQANYNRPQQANYSRPQQSRTNGQQASKPNDILSRATANVRENDADMLEMQMTGAQMMADAHVLAGAIDISGTSELMREVSDLMVTGYQADLTFERDFVAEGVEMLNRFELPAEG